MINIDGFDLDITDEELEMTENRRELGLSIMDTLPAAPRMIREFFISGTNFSFQEELFAPPDGSKAPLFSVIPGRTALEYLDIGRFVNGDSDVTVTEIPEFPCVDFCAFIPEITAELDARGLLLADLLASFPRKDGMCVVIQAAHEWPIWLSNFNQQLINRVIANNRQYLKENVEAWVGDKTVPPNDVAVHPWVRAQVKKALEGG